MVKLYAVAAVLVAALPTVASAQDENPDVRLAKLETILITADKAQPRDYKPDDKTAALLAEIAKEGALSEAPKPAPVKAKK
jgi:hypothetical protein